MDLRCGVRTAQLAGVPQGTGGGCTPGYWGVRGGERPTCGATVVNGCLRCGVRTAQLAGVPQGTGGGGGCSSTPGYWGGGTRRQGGSGRRGAERR